MNRKAQSAYYFIPVIALVSCTAALLAMLSARENLNAQADGIAEISNELEFTQAIINSKLRIILLNAISSCQNCDDGQLKESVIEELKKSELQFRYVMDTNAFAKIRNGGFSIFSTKNEYILFIDEFELFIKNEGNELKRVSSLTIARQKDQ